MVEAQVAGLMEMPVGFVNICTMRGMDRAMNSEADRIIGLYQRHAQAWARDRGNRLFETVWLNRFCGLLPPAATVLDVGCGTGEPIARYLIEQGCHVTGVDTALAMIAMCENYFPRLAWHVADMRTLSLGRTFNGVLAWDSFFHLKPDDQRRMFPVFRKHAAPRAALMFTSGPRHSEVIGAYQSEPLYHASLDGAEYHALLDEKATPGSGSAKVRCGHSGLVQRKRRIRTSRSVGRPKQATSPRLRQ
jgi:SAM-dependent methyltransferase